jgi:hypothetical protein
MVHWLVLVHYGRHISWMISNRLNYGEGEVSDSWTSYMVLVQQTFSPNKTSILPSLTPFFFWFCSFYFLCDYNFGSFHTSSANHTKVV